MGRIIIASSTTRGDRDVEHLRMVREGTPDAFEMFDKLATR